MRTIRVAMLALAMCIGTATLAHAQGGGGRGGRGGVGMLLRDITLSPEQQAKVDEISKRFSEMNQPLMEAVRGGDADARKKMTENNEKRNEEIKKVLTEDQRKVFDAHVEEQKARMNRPPGSL